MTAEQWVKTAGEGKSERDKRLLKRAADTYFLDILKPAESEKLPWGDNIRGIAPSWKVYHGIWDWDSAFHAIGVSRFDTQLAREQITPYFETQREDGMFIDAWNTNGTIVNWLTKPPIMFWAYETVDRADPNDALLAEAYPHFLKNESFWRTKRSHNGLFFYSSDATDARRSAWAKCESGWDTTPRYDGETAEYLWSVDINCYMVLVYRALQYMASRLGLKEDVARFVTAEDELTERINKTLWCDDIGAYCDVYRDDCAQKFNVDKVGGTGHLSPASFMPLFVGIAPRENAEKMATLASDGEKFYPLMPSITYDSPAYTPQNYWRGPTWINIAYIAVKGLKNYGFDGLADGYRERILDMCDAEKRGLFEYYNSKNGEGLGAIDYGWTATFVIEFILNF